MDFIPVSSLFLLHILRDIIFNASRRRPPTEIAYITRSNLKNRESHLAREDHQHPRLPSV